MIRPVGRFTAAFALIGAGAVLIVDNVTGTSNGIYLGRLWPILLVALGLEWLWTVNRSGEQDRARFDGSAILLLVIISIAASAWGARWRGPDFIHRGSWSGPIPPSVPMPPLPPFRSVSAEATITHEDAITAMKELDLETSSARVDVEAGERFRIEMRVIGRAATSEEALRNANSARLHVEPGSTTRVRADRPLTDAVDVISFRVVVPAGVGAGIKTSSGTVAAANISGALKLQTTSGSVLVTQAGDGVQVSSSSGSIRVDGAKGSVSASTSSGSISIQGADGPVDAQSTSGTVTVDSNRIGGHYDLSANSGSVRLTIPAGASVSVNARSTSGTVSAPRWMAVGEGRNSASGTQGSGDFRLTIRTTSGGISIHER